MSRGTELAPREKYIARLTGNIKLVETITVIDALCTIGVIVTVLAERDLRGTGLASC